MAERHAAARSASSRSKRQPSSADVSEKYRGHEIVIPADDPGRRVLIDGEPFRYGLSGGGRFYLSAYAYASDESLISVVRKFVDHRDESAARRAKGTAR
jgi:hypothetical protein